MQRLEIPVLKALYDSIDSKKYRKRKSKLIFDWKSNVLKETGKMPKSKDRMYDVLNGVENTLDFEHKFLEDRIPREWKEIFGETNLENEIIKIRERFTKTKGDFSKKNCVDLVADNGLGGYAPNILSKSPII